MRPSECTGQMNAARERTFCGSSGRESFCASATQSGSPLCHTLPTRPTPDTSSSLREAAMKRSASGVPLLQASSRRIAVPELSIVK